MITRYGRVPCPCGEQSNFMSYEVEPWGEWVKYGDHAETIRCMEANHATEIRRLQADTGGDANG